MISSWGAKLAIKEKLKAALYPTDVDIVRLGLPVLEPTLNEKRRIYILAVAPYQSTPIFESGSQIRVSDYIVPLAIEVEYGTGNDPDGQETAETALALLVGQVEALCVADPAWGSTLIFSSGLSMAQEAAGPIADVQGGGGFLAHCILNVHVRTQGD